MNAAPARQRGVALLVALLVVALAVILVAALLDRGELTLARTRNALRAEQAEAYAQGLEIYAAQVLQETQGSGPDSNSSPWAMPLPPQPVPGGLISASMRDLNGCFNLNNLAGVNAAAWLQVFQRLLTVRGVTDPAIVGSVQAWLGGKGSSADDNFYLAQTVPYRAAHRNFAHVSELRLLRGVSSDVYARLAPFVCALPQGTPININTASVPLLQAMGTPALSQAQGEHLWQNGQARWASVAEVRKQATQQNIVLDPNLTDAMVGTASTYFLARGDIVLDAVPFTFYSLIQFVRGGPSGGVRVLERSRGSDEALVAAAPIAAQPAEAD